MQNLGMVLYMTILRILLLGFRNMQEMLEKLMTERKTALASVFEKLFCICLNKNGFYFSPNLNRNIDISCFYCLPKPAQRLGIKTLDTYFSTTNPDSNRKGSAA